MTSDDADTAKRHAWARPYFDRVQGPIPRYGSPEFNDITGDDPHRCVASALVAAECWATYVTGDVPARVRAEVVAEREAYEACEAEDHERVAEAAERFVRSHANSPSHVELCRQRGEPTRAERAERRTEALRDWWNPPNGGVA